MNRTLLLAVSLSFGSSLGAAPFYNLDFEQAITNNVNFDPRELPFGPVAELLPGWQLANPGGQYSSIFYNSAALGHGWVSLLPKENIVELSPLPEFGLYSLAMDPDTASPFMPITLSQRGDVPADAKIITFLNFGSPFELKFNNSVISLGYQLVSQSGFPNRQVNQAIGDISAFAGQNIEMKFAAFFDFGIHGIDSIAFAIPEPSSGVLITIGCLMFSVIHAFGSRALERLIGRDVVLNVPDQRSRCLHGKKGGGRVETSAKIPLLLGCVTARRRFQGRWGQRPSRGREVGSTAFPG